MVAVAPAVHEGEPMCSKALAAGMPVIKRLEELATIGGDSRSSSMTQILDYCGAVVSGWTV